MNALEDRQIIEALYDASAAGVEIDLIVRGICRLRPGLPGQSETIRVISIVGRLLEHARIFYFANAGEPEYFFGSADWMSRNLDARVEAAVPVEEPAPPGGAQGDPRPPARRQRQGLGHASRRHLRPAPPGAGRGAALQPGDADAAGVGAGRAVEAGLLRDRDPFPGEALGLPSQYPASPALDLGSPSPLDVARGRSPDCWRRPSDCWRRSPSCWRRPPSCRRRSPDCWRRLPDCRR